MTRKRTNLNGQYNKTMPDGNTQPTILVKKIDGTFARMTLTEIAAMKKVDAKPPVVQLTPKSRVSVLKKDDFTSPLEDKLPARQDGAPVIPATRSQEADEVLKKIKFFISPDNISRLRNLIQLRLKDIRGEKEFLEELAAPVKDKGLGLDGRQAGEILRLCQETMNKSAKETPGVVKPLKGKVGLPMVEESEIPATATPFNAFKHSSLSSAPKSQNPNPKSQIEPAVMSRQSEVKAEKIFKISPQPARPVMRDVIAKNTGVGPIDEIRLINLVDFRRLSVDPQEAAARFKQKLENLKAESYLLYMDALNAWRESPLYLEYLETVSNSLKLGKNLTVVISDKNKVQFSEIKALVEMEKSL